MNDFNPDDYRVLNQPTFAIPQYERSRRKSKSIFWQIVQVILGGAAGILSFLYLSEHFFPDFYRSICTLFNGRV